MDKIEVSVLNPAVILDSERMMVTAARLTQRGHTIKNLADFQELCLRKYSPDTVRNMVALPHPTIQKFGAINVVVVGASRRFLAQITRHQNEVKFMSASLQYSDYSTDADFVVPYAMLEKQDPEAIEKYISLCKAWMAAYKAATAFTDNDTAGYTAPQSLRNVLIISATPYQWKHMIRQRICHRNTAETRYVLLRIWQQLYAIAPALFADAAPVCAYGKSCPEGRMSCGMTIKRVTPEDILQTEFPLLCKNGRPTDEN